MVQMNIDDDLDAALLPVKMMVGFYIGGMGAKGQNYHTKLMERFGYVDEALHIQQLFMDGRRDEAIAAVPDEFADAISLCGPVDRIRERLDAWKASPVTTLLVTGGGDQHLLRTAAELVLE